jgi:transaldolase/glucose-6-phosphate isomerase
VIYIEELIGKYTVNTVPPATLEAFFDHGNAIETIHNGLSETRKFLIELEKNGISLDKATQELEVEGVKAFADAFTQLLEAVEQRRKAAIVELGSLARGVKNQITKLDEMDFSDRLFKKDPTLWSSDPVGMAEIKERMNWLTAPSDSQVYTKELIDFSKDCVLRGYTHAVLLGMGGSSLAPEVLSLICKSEHEKNRHGLKLAILDSTDPDQVAAIERIAPIENTLYIVASKSGTTGEINAFLAYFWDLAFKQFGEKAGEHFIAITDPNTKLADLALTRRFLKIFTADPRVGGRNSALTAFGIVPAALIGMDVESLLSNASATADLCQPDNPIPSNPGLVLGAIIGYAVSQGKDKLTVIADTTWKPLGAWLEQLVAESSGKDGKGIVPVSDEFEIPPDKYGYDRLFVYIRQNGEHQQFADGLIKNGHPVITLDVKSPYDLGGQFYLWEFATATACSIIGVNSFDQPDVQDAKTRTLKGLEEYRKNGRFSEINPTIVMKNARVMTRQEVKASDLSSVLEIILKYVNDYQNNGDYIAINAFLPRNTQNLVILQDLRANLLKKFKLATTLGFGPRYLHSTGQLHKGGGNNGIFLLITASRSKDIEIPGEGISFGNMQRAQALGDLQALEAKNRRVLWIDLTKPDPGLLMEN